MGMLNNLAVCLTMMSMSMLKVQGGKAQKYRKKMKKNEEAWRGDRTIYPTTTIPTATAPNNLPTIPPTAIAEAATFCVASVADAAALLLPAPVE